MNIDRVRKIDYWIGVPACFFFSLVRKVFKPFGRKPKKDPKKFLFIELSEMGSAVLAYPTMKALKERFPGAELFFLIFAKNRGGVDLLKIIPEKNVWVIRSEKATAFLLDTLKVIVKMRRERLDCVFDLELFARVTALLSFFSGAPIRIGFHRFRMEGLYRGDLHTHLVQYNFQQHMSKTFLSFLQVLSYPEKDWPAMDRPIDDEAVEPAVYEGTEAGKARIRQKVKDRFPHLEPCHRLILFNPSAGEIPIRAWPVEHYIALGRRLLGDPRNVLILIGAESDREITEQVFRGIDHPHCLQFTGLTTLPELLDLFSVAHLLVTNDSGPGHFASMTGISVVIFFGPETPRLYRPLGRKVHVFYADFPCSPCLTAYNHRNTPCRDNKCLKTITVEQVYTLIQEGLLAGTNERPRGR
jgi:ADP-heptose:LPS heptosyltransferase